MPRTGVLRFDVVEATGGRPAPPGRRVAPRWGLFRNTGNDWSHPIHCHFTERGENRSSSSFARARLPSSSPWTRGRCGARTARSVAPAAPTTSRNGRRSRLRSGSRAGAAGCQSSRGGGRVTDKPKAYRPEPALDTVPTRYTIASAMLILVACSTSLHGSSVVSFAD